MIVFCIINFLMITALILAYRVKQKQVKNVIEFCNRQSKRIEILEKKLKDKPENFFK